MKGYLLLRRLKIENANMVAGLTWGFPAVSQFLGFTHALDRKLRAGHLATPSVLGGCAIICHKQQPHSKVDNYGAHHFCLTRNPLTKEGNTAPFNEEGRMHLEVSLIIELNISLEKYYVNVENEDVIDEQIVEPNFIASVEKYLGLLRIAGGFCIDFESCEIIKREGESKRGDLEAKRLLFSLLPGFALIDRSELLTMHHETLKSHEEKISLIEAWMEFGGLRFRYNEASNTLSDDESDVLNDTDEENTGEWEHVQLPEQGWFVPLMIGFQPIARLQEPDSVKASRDDTCPTCPVEAIYGVGQWLAPYRVKQIDKLIWRYQYDGHAYHFHNAGGSSHKDDSATSEN